MIESVNLIIRPYNEEDFESFLCLQNENPIFNSFDKDIIRLCARKAFEISSCERFSIFEKATGQYCGNIEYHKEKDEEYPEIGISLLSDKQNKGIGTEAVICFCNDCFCSEGVDTVLIRIEHNNLRSKHLFEKLGAVYIGNKTIPIFEKLYKEMDRSIPDNSQLGADTYYLKLPIK